ncbi:uncharacterized protein LOC132054632 [Lycium ferocissimum]|uniref:uncharacterized protein LOC132054632 n=1 Tax=Lycium ferocissimum TaxID=112874 RepID=UPI0028157FFD|nr:uncharacterized protein LOC132054632 [Lycium ferocissimum]
MTRKSDNYAGKVPNDSTVHAANDAGNLNSHAGNENYKWKRIQKNNANASNFDLKNLDFSQIDDELDDDPLNKQLPSAVDVILSSKSADTNQEILVSKDLGRSKSPLSQQECGIAQGSHISRARLNCTPQSNEAVGSAGKIAGIKSLGSASVSHTGNNNLKSRYQKKNVQPASGSQTSNNITEEPPAAKYQPPISSSLNVVINAGHNIENIKALPGVPEEDCKNATASKLMIHGDKARGQTFCGLQNDFRSLCRAVSEAHRTQLAVEAIEMSKGYPVAEFEKLLHSASPVICPSVNIRTCQGCVHGLGAPLCRHEIPNISLGNFWQWYEKNGSYGLEVKAEEHKRCKQHGFDRLKFSAYFVPYLSAIQLFKDNGTLGSIDVVDSGKNKISESSPSVDFHTIFSTVIPKPRIEDSSSLPRRKVVSDSGSSSKYSDTELHHPPVEYKLSDDNVELLFEFFERDQPQSRKHLFEKIRELIAGRGPSSGGVYGDPSILQSARLPELHPHSWFSVAWYPIYRIPNGNFRAAFLTYHSLGHYVNRGHALGAHRLDTCIVSPVVGLQSYNAQGECWFQPRHSTNHLKEVTLDSDPPSVLRDRLKTLEQTASLMSRAKKTNGTETLVNKHSDYEFFLSRRRVRLP